MSLQVRGGESRTQRRRSKRPDTEMHSGNDGTDRHDRKDTTGGDSPNCTKSGLVDESSHSVSLEVTSKPNSKARTQPATRIGNEGDDGGKRQVQRKSRWNGEFQPILGQSGGSDVFSDSDRDDDENGNRSPSTNHYANTSSSSASDNEIDHGSF